ncbi:MAG: zf-HC2 domain-containing protein [Gemmatimonadales bacterium]|jgi:anti-sigma factor RsiW
MSDRWTDRLSEYLDGELEAAERTRLEAHLEGCEECAATLEQLRRVVAWARAAEDRPPANELWPGIAERIGAKDVAVTDIDAHRRRRWARVRDLRVSLSVPQLAAAGIALMIASGGAGLLLSGDAGPAGEGAAPATAGGTSIVPAVAPAGVAIPTYDTAVAELEQLIDETRDQLDPATVRVIEENLMKIDRAIAQAQRALAQDPASVYLSEHLAATMQQKLEFLRRTARLAGAVS